MNVWVSLNVILINIRQCWSPAILTFSCHGTSVSTILPSSIKQICVYDCYQIYQVKKTFNNNTTLYLELVVQRHALREESFQVQCEWFSLVWDMCYRKWTDVAFFISVWNCYTFQRNKDIDKRLFYYDWGDNSV